jgi:ATP-binding cassette, subfamily B, bacterial
MQKLNSTNLKTLSLFWHYARVYKRFLIPLLIFVPIAVTMLWYIAPFIMSLVLQKISQRDFDANNIWNSFGPYIIGYAVATYLSGFVIWRFNIWLLWNLELNVSRDLAKRIFDHLMNMSPSFHANRFAGSLVSQSNKLTGAYVRIADAFIFNLYPLVIGMVATLVILGPRVPAYAIALLVLSIIYIIGNIYFSRPVRDANAAEATAQSQQTGYLSDSISNVTAIKSFATSEYEKRRFWGVLSYSREAGLKSMRTTTIRETYSSIITSTISVAALIIAVWGASTFNANIATLFLIVSYTSDMGQRLWEFQNVLRQFNRGLGDASDMVKILQIKPDIKDPENPEPVKIGRGSITINNMTFTHSENSDALFKNLSLRVKAGEKVGLVGRSGSGKTTLTKLLLRFSDIDSGKILIDGQNICAVTQDDLRSRITYVPQEPLLFHRSLAENIAYGGTDITQQEIEAIARMAHAHEFIIKLPKGYETLVGERGVKLSGGQRQRVAIARAMLKNAPILLLDEATSALDSESEELIQDALWKLMEGRTAIVIAHRLSTVQKMDRILVMDEGKIIEEGSHKELIRANGPYADLWNRQSGGFLDE